MPILWTEDIVRDANIDREAARYDPEPGTRLLTSAVALAILVLFATLMMAGAYITTIKYREQQAAELTR